jgi:hypothetical protein
MPRTEQSAHIVFDDIRPSESPFIERVWRSHSERGGEFIAVASTHWEFVVSRVQGQVMVTLHGGETRARRVQCPADGEWFSIRFKPQAFLPQVPPGALLDGGDQHLPVRSGRRFLFDHRWWEIPAFDNAEIFVRRLAAAGLLVNDTGIEQSLETTHARQSLRTSQRHLRGRLGMTRSLMLQIERARHAVQLLRAGHAIGDVAGESGYFDQAHLSRALRRFTGLTPAMIARRDLQLSFLYKTGAADPA